MAGIPSARSNNPTIHYSKTPSIRARVRPPIQQSISPLIRLSPHSMTTRGKIVLTILFLGVVGFCVYRWWDKTAPQTKPQIQSIDVVKVKQEIADVKKAAADIPLLI